MSSLPTPYLSEWGSLRPRGTADSRPLQTRPSAVARSERPEPEIDPAAPSVARYHDGASLTALAAFALRVRASGLPAARTFGTTAANDEAVRHLSSGSVRPGGRVSGIVERRSVSESLAPPSRPSCA